MNADSLALEGLLFFLGGVIFTVILILFVLAHAPDETTARRDGDIEHRQDESDDEWAMRLFGRRRAS